MKIAPRPVSRRTSDYRLCADPEFLDALEAAGLTDAAGFAMALRSGREVPGGRGPHRLVALPGGGPLLRLREARRGGVLGRLFSSRYLSHGRIARELELWLVLRERGAPLPTPVAAISRRRGGLWESHFGTLDRAESVDGLGWLRAAPSPDALRRSARALGTGLRRFHDAGAVHGDLNLRNVLIEHDATGVHCLFIDLANARERQPVSAPERMRDWMRLARSIEKSGFASIVGRRIRALALSAYCAGDRRLRKALLASSRRESRRLARHRLAWRVAGRKVAGWTLLASVALVAPGCGDSAISTSEGAGSSAWSILALGDTGRIEERSDWLEGQLAVADALTREARRSPVAGLVLLGDNFYDHGLSEADLVRRVRVNLVRPYCHFLRLTGPRSAEVTAACPLAEDERRPVPLFAVLGNHDLEGPESLRLQRDAIPRFLPDWQMSAGLTRVVEVHPGVSLILFESEIAIDDRATLHRELLAAIRSARGPWRILATHRPIATDDVGRPPEGGYPKWVRDVIAEAAVPVQLVLCGHHHSLQAFALGDPTPLLQIGAGSGSRAEPPLATGHPDLRYSRQSLGFARIDLRGAQQSEWLEITLFSVPPWPWLERILGHRPGARFRVELSGRVESVPAREAGSLPDA